MNGDFFLDLFVQYGYWLVFVGILLDHAGLPLPGELILLTFGALSRTSELELGRGSLTAVTAALIGDGFGYWLGRLGEDRVLRTYCWLTLGSGQCVQNARHYYARHGKVTVVFGRFLVGVRAFLNPLAGSARMPFPQFVFFDTLGALLWSAGFILAGYGLGWQVGSIQHGYRGGYMLLAGLAGGSFVAYLLMKFLRYRRHGAGVLRAAESAVLPELPPVVVGLERVDPRPPLPAARFVVEPPSGRTCLCGAGHSLGCASSPVADPAMLQARMGVQEPAAPQASPGVAGLRPGEEPTS